MFVLTYSLFHCILNCYLLFPFFTLFTLFYCTFYDPLHIYMYVEERGMEMSPLGRWWPSVVRRRVLVLPYLTAFLLQEYLCLSSSSSVIAFLFSLFFFCRFFSRPYFFFFFSFLLSAFQSSLYHRWYQRESETHRPFPCSLSFFPLLFFFLCSKLSLLVKCDSHVLIFAIKRGSELNITSFTFTLPCVSGFPPCFLFFSFFPFYPRANHLHC